MTLPGDRPARTFRELAALIRGQINRGELAPGRWLPSERDLMAIHGLGRETVRRAMRELRHEGLVTFERGHGHVVREPVARATVRLQRGSRVWVRMPTPEERDQYELDEGVSMVVVEYGGREPQAYPSDRHDFTTS